MKRQLQNRYTAQNDADLYAPQVVDLGEDGSSQNGVTQWEGLSHSANCKALLKI